mmetsp:Transcript_88468/g.270806  ORF Transcript_88468/g.270806 Transcript_88468/m.270806 type:complete len:204 (-) Transcript_88468:7-618(-)
MFSSATATLSCKASCTSRTRRSWTAFSFTQASSFFSSELAITRLRSSWTSRLAMESLWPARVRLKCSTRVASSPWSSVSDAAVARPSSSVRTPRISASVFSSWASMDLNFLMMCFTTFSKFAKEIRAPSSSSSLSPIMSASRSSKTSVIAPRRAANALLLSSGGTAVPAAPGAAGRRRWRGAWPALLPIYWGGHMLGWEEGPA